MGDEYIKRDDAIAVINNYIGDDSPYAQWFARKIEQIDAVPRWIPRGERLPREKEVVLITNSEGNVRCGQFGGAISNRLFWIGNTLEMVEAWMPLPEPYVAERRDDE